MDKYYQDIEVGAEFLSPGKTITEADIVGFAALSGDWFPLHTDEECSRRGPYKARIAHGLLGLALTEGMKFRIPEFMNVAYIASLYRNYRFIDSPVRSTSAIQFVSGFVSRASVRRKNLSGAW